VTRIFHWLFMWKMDPMSGSDIRLVFTLPPSDSTLKYKRSIHLWNNFLCIKSLYLIIYLYIPISDCRTSFLVHCIVDSTVHRLIFCCTLWPVICMYMWAREKNLKCFLIKDVPCTELSTKNETKDDLKLLKYDNP